MPLFTATSEGVIVADKVDRSALPLRRPAFDGVVNRTLAGSRPDWDILSSPKAPEGAPNVLVVLTDDAGFGQSSTFGGEVSTPALSRLADNGLGYNAFPVTALCSPTRAALLTARNHHSVGFGSIGELSTGFPGYSGFFPTDSAPFPRALQENGYSTAAFGKWHLTPDHQQGPAGPFDRWPNRLVRLRLGLSRRRGRPVRPGDHREPDDDRATAGRRLLPPRRDDRQDDRVAARRPGAGARQAVVRLLLDRTRARTAPRPARVDRGVQGALRRRLGCLSRADVRAPEAARGHPGRRGADAPQRGVPGVGVGPRGAAAAAGTADGGLRRLHGERRLERRAPRRRDRRDGRAREHARDLHPWRQRREHGGRRHRRVQRAHHAERRRAQR